MADGEVTGDWIQSPLWAVGGGKGGVGKSLTSVNLATYLAMMGRRVVLIDGDLGGADLHTLLGMAPPKRSLAHFLGREVERLEDVLVETEVPHLRLMAGASDIIGLANPKYAQKQRLIRHLNKLEADELILDLGAGTSFAVLDLFNAASRRLIVCTPDPTAIQDTYAFLKTALHRRIKVQMAPRNAPDTQLRKGILEAIEGQSTERAASTSELQVRVRSLSQEGGDALDGILEDFRTFLVMNMATEREGKATAQALSRVVRDFLSVELHHAVTIVRDADLARSVRRMRPLLLDAQGGPRWADFATIAATVLRVEGRYPEHVAVLPQEEDAPLPPALPE